MLEKAVCTIITKSYLPYARTLATSLAKYNPGIKLYVLLADKVDNYFDPSLEPFKFIYLEDLSESDTNIIEQMCFYYTPFELCCALRGALHEYMFEQTNIQKWIFLDSDIMVFSSLDIIFNQLETTSILLTPHNSIKPVSSEYISSCEIDFLRCGLYNAGFLGLKRTSTSKEFIMWFKDRLKSFAFDDSSNQQSMSRGLFVDQLWLNLVPLYFKEVKYCVEPGANLGYWNLFDRSLTKDSFGNIIVNEEPVLFIHFSGWDINNINMVSKYSSIYDERMPNFWLEISELYQDNLLRNGWSICSNFPYAFSSFHGGKSITSKMRQQYYEFVKKGKLLSYSPFSDEYYLRLKLIHIYTKYLIKIPGLKYMVNVFKINKVMY